MLVNASNLEILDMYNDVGTAPDFRMFKASLAGVVPEGILALADSGYQGINEYLPNAVIPFKASKKHPLTGEQKVFTAALAKSRVAVEHINREIQIFRICKETYRNKGNRCLLRVKLIAILYNHRMGF